MEDIRSKFAVIIFIVILAVFVIGGYFGTKYMLNRPKEETKEEIVEITEKRIDPSKDYMYFSEEENVVEEYLMGYKKITINFESGKTIESTLNKEVEEYSKTVVKLNEENTPETITFPNEEGIFSLTYKNYEIIEYGNYVTLIAEDFKYDVVSYTTALKIDSFIFNKNTGLIVTEEDLLKINDITIDEIKGLIRTKLEVLNLDSNINKVDETVKNLDYALYVNNLGKLEIRYLVKSTKQDYYDKLVIN